MKKIAIITAILMLGLVSGAWADFTYDLTVKIDGGPPLTPIASLGTVTFADDTVNANNVIVTVDLNSGLNIQEFAFNFDSSTLPAGLSISPSTIKSDLNNIKPDGYKGFFDFKVPSNGNINGDPWVGTLSATGNLDASMFNALDTLGNLHVAVHIGAGTAGLPGGLGSLWAGDAPEGYQIPEPGSLLLLGFGLLGLGAVARRS